MATHTVIVDNITFEVSSVTATRTRRYGHYNIDAVIDGIVHEATMNLSYLYDDMYRETETDEDIERQADAEIAVARIIIRANQLV
jgi:hypothetical protein